MIAPGQPKTLILTVYGAYGRKLGGWLAVADLVTLMAQLGTNEQAVRSAVSRMKRRGLLLREERNGDSGYLLSEQALQLLEEGDRRIFAHYQPASMDAGWVLVAFSIPENERDKRHTLRTQLTWLGFGNLLNGLWIAPARLLESLRDSVRQLGFEQYVHVFEGTYGGFSEPEAVLRSSWDIDQLQAMYEEFLTHLRPMLRQWAGLDPSEHHPQAFADYTLLLHEWRKFPYLDPQLPAELLPADWEGWEAADGFFAIRDRLSEAAMNHVRVTVGQPSTSGRSKAAQQPVSRVAQGS